MGHGPTPFAWASGEMPIDANYEDEEEQVVAKATKSSNAPNLNDQSAFPEATWGAGAEGPAFDGKSFASLAAETLPPQKSGLDLNQPIRIKVARPPVKPRITKVREAYKRDNTKRLGSFTMYHDEGMPAGVSEKKASCEMAEVGSTITNVQEFNSSWRELEKLPKDEGTNVRLFRSEYQEPSPEDEKLEKGGKYQLRVSKAIAQDMFEELCLYAMDARLDNAVVGVCWCIRANLDLIQMWTKNPASAASAEVFSGKLRMLLGVDTSCGVDYSRFADIFGSKASNARKFYLVEGQAPMNCEVATAVNNIVQMREFGTKKEKKKDAENFTEIPGRGEKVVKAASKESSTDDAAPATGNVGVVNNYANLMDDNDEEDASVEQDNIQLFEKKKSDKTRKISTKKGSKKEKKGGKDDFDLPTSSAPLVSQQTFVVSGLAGVLFVALLALVMSGVLN